MMLRGVYTVRGTRYEGGQALYDLCSPGETEGVELPGAPAFGVYGLVSRPAGPANDNGGAGARCEAVVADEGGSPMVVATRDLRAEDVVGPLAEGDVALWSVGGGYLRCNGDGVTSLVKNGAGGTADAAFQFGKDGSARLVTPFGGFEFGPNGVKVYNANGTVLELAGDVVQVVATFINLVYSSLGLGPAPSLPMAVTTPGPQAAAVAVPVPSILVTPG